MNFKTIFKTIFKTKPKPTHSDWRRGLLAALLLSSSTVWAQDSCMALTLQEIGGTPAASVGPWINDPDAA